MVGKLTWSRTALDDIEAIATFVARESRSHARRLVERFFEAAEVLLKQRTLEPSIPERPSGQLREHHIDGFRLLYERRGDDLYIIAVTPGHRLVKTYPPALPTL